MFHKTTLAALGLALMSSAALAQPADPSNGPPARLDRPDNSDSAYPDDADASTAPQDERRGERQDDRQDDRYAPSAQQQADARSRDLFCRRDAAARTGYVSPDAAASHAQTSGSVGGTVLGAAAGAAIGSASGHAGAGALIGAGAGLLAGTAIGQDNARRAASDVELEYGDAYYACMNEADGANPAQYAQAPPPPRPYPYYGYAPYPYYYPYSYPYYGPAVTFGFGFGGYHGYRGGFRGGYHGGSRGGYRHH